MHRRAPRSGMVGPGRLGNPAAGLRVLRSALRRAAGATRHRRALTSRDAERIAEQVIARVGEQMEQQVHARGDVLDESVRHYVRWRAGRLDRAVAENFRQLEALGDLRALLRPRALMPPARGWAASPDVLHTLVEAILTRRPALVVECGSGLSSLWMGYALEYVGAGSLVALEHDDRYLDANRLLLQRHGLEDRVEIRRAPLETRQLAGTAEDWYAEAAVERLEGIGLVFVDGPPGREGHLARYPAVPLLLPRCAPDVVVVLDDADRAEERETSERWLSEFPELERRRQPHEKGCDVFTRRHHAPS